MLILSENCTLMSPGSDEFGTLRVPVYDAFTSGALSWTIWSRLAIMSKVELFVFDGVK